MRRAVLPLLVLAIIVLLVFAGGEIRERLNLDLGDEPLEGLRTWVGGFGALGPAVFVLVVVFRSFLLLPSHLVLLSGGLVFGALLGTLWGALGLGLGGAFQYLAARVFGDAWTADRDKPDEGHWSARVKRAGPTLVGVATAHPAGPITAVNVGAGLARLPFLSFVFALVLGAPVRAGAFATLGDSIMSWGLGTSLAIAVGLGTLAGLPLLHPGVRQWLFGAPPAKATPEEA